ncbi:MAG: 60S ribosomal export protein NMD3 [Candidatus Hadarchaeales archaeon]
MRRFCYKCGALEKDAGPLVEGLCQRCFRESFRLELPDKVELTSCKICGSFLIRGEWMKVTKEEAVMAELNKKMRLPDGLKFEVKTKDGTEMICVFGSVGEPRKIPIEIEKPVKIEKRFMTCKLCSLRKAGYYEAIVQVRGIPSQEISKILRKSKDDLLISEEDFISEFVPLENGADIYVSNISLGRRLSSVFKGMGAKITSTSKLISQTKDGKKRYRVTFLVRF